MCGLRGAVVSVVAFKVKGRGLKHIHGCSLTVQKKPSISSRIFCQCTLKYILPTYHLYCFLLLTKIDKQVELRQNNCFFKPTTFAGRWSAQAQLMRNEILDTLASWPGVASLVGGCWENGESFMPASGVRRESVSHCQSNCLFVSWSRVHWGEYGVFFCELYYAHVVHLFVIIVVVVIIIAIIIIYKEYSMRFTYNKRLWPLPVAQKHKPPYYTTQEDRLNYYYYYYYYYYCYYYYYYYYYYYSNRHLARSKIHKSVSF